MADGKIIFDTAVDQSGMKNDLREIKGGMGGLKKTIGKVGLAIAAAFSVHKVVQFGKACIQLGSDLAEVQNVVDVTFTTMSDAVDEFAQNAMYTAGLSETMAKRYMGTFGAMSKSFGFAEDSAFEMSKQLTQLAGDVASFYNITQDEAYTKLKAVYTGETEALKDLGVVMTQAALDQYAMAHGIGKTVQEMTEQEKVALRYRFVLEKLTGASGDFLRTQDGWANQTRLLSLQFEQLKATIGQGLINVLTPALKMLNNLLGTLQKVAASFRDLTAQLFGDASAGSGGGAVAEDMSAAAGSTEDLAGGIEDVGQAAKAAKRELAGFDQITRLGNDIGTTGTTGIGTSGSFLPPSLNQDVAAVEKAGGLTGKLSESLSGLGKAFKDLGRTITEHFGWIWEDIFVPLGQWSIKEAAPALVNTLASALESLSAAGGILSSAFEEMWPHIQPVFEFLGESFTESLENLQWLFGETTQFLDEHSEEIENILTGLGEAFGALWTVTEPILTALKETSELTSKGMVIALGGAFGQLIDGTSGFISTMRAIFNGDWSEVWELYKEHLHTTIFNLIDLGAQFAELFGADFDEAREAAVGAVNGIIGAINALISGLVAGVNFMIDAINGINFVIPDWVPNWGGSRFQMNIPRIQEYPQIPHLAQGAVLPPNKPFMAVVGDQRHGTNVEAPLETIKQAVAEVIGGNTDKLDEVIDLLRAILARSGVYLDGKQISDIVTKYQRNAARAGG